SRKVPETCAPARSGFSLRGSRPGEIRAQAFVDRAAVLGLLVPGCRVEERVVARGHAVRVEAHQVGHDSADSALLVIEHDRRAAGRAGAELQRTVRVLVVERLTLQVIRLVDLEVAVL